MNLKFDTSFVNSIKKELEDIKAEVQASMSTLPPTIAEITLEQVLNRDNWNNSARYGIGPKKGSKYDGEFSGNMIRTIRETVVAKTEGNSGFSVKIGDISRLDALKTQSESSSSLASKNFPYWRSFVYGRKRIKGYRFVWDGVSYYPFGDAKPKGQIKYRGAMSGTDGTYMFHNGLHAASKKIDEAVRESLREAVGRVKNKWR